jgi:hypothetical protein
MYSSINISIRFMVLKGAFSLSFLELFNLFNIHTSLFTFRIPLRDLELHRFGKAPCGMQIS